MLKISQRLIFVEGGVLLLDLQGKEIRTYSKRHFLEGSHYLVTNSLLGEISGNLLIEIYVPIEVVVKFEAQINANVPGAKAYATADGAFDCANVLGADAYATADRAIVCASARGAKAYANVKGAIAHAAVSGAEAYANVPGAKAYANAPGAEAYAIASGAEAYANESGALVIQLS